MEKNRLQFEPNFVIYLQCFISRIINNNNNFISLKTDLQQRAELLLSIGIITLRPHQFYLREHGFFSKFEGSVGWKKKENKKIPQFFALTLIINKSFL